MDLGVRCGAVLLQVKQNKSGRTIFYADHAQKVVLPGITPQLQRILSRPEVQHSLHHHIARAVHVPPGVLGDIYDGEVWRHWRSVQAPHGQTWFSYPHFDIGLVYNSDSFDPWVRGAYSIYGLYMVIANLPRVKRFNREHMILVALFPGSLVPRSEPALRIAISGVRAVAARTVSNNVFMFRLRGLSVCRQAPRSHSVITWPTPWRSW